MRAVLRIDGLGCCIPIGENSSSPGEEAAQRTVDGFRIKETSVSAKKRNGLRIAARRNIVLGNLHAHKQYAERSADLPEMQKPMEHGRVRVEGYPYLPSFECWLCLEVISETVESQ